MSILRISSFASIHVPDYKNLLAAWRMYGGKLSLVESFTVEEPLTPPQRRQLPAELRRRLK